MKQLFILMVLVLLLPSHSLATSWAYPFVVWNGYSYEVTDEYVENVDREIGHVTSYSDMETHGGNFSNSYHKGTKYYSIKGVSTDEAIAVEIGKVKFKKSVRRGEYALANTPSNSVYFSLGILIVAGVFASLLYVLKKQT